MKNKQNAIFILDKKFFSSRANNKYISLFQLVKQRKQK